MASNFNDTTPAAPAGSLNVKWQTDGAGNDSASFTTPYDVRIFNAGVGTNNQELLFLIPCRALKFPAGAAGSTSKSKTAATASTTYTFLKNGVSFATLVFGIGATTGTWTQASDATFNGTSDILEVTGPATADATLASFGFMLQGIRTA